MTTFPIYILDFDGSDVVMFPDDKTDISHSKFWESTVAAVVAKHFRIPLKPLTNLSYCQRRARVTDKGIVYYGEKQTKKLLKAIGNTIGVRGLSWQFDDHEKRLSLDVSEFNQLLAEHGQP